MHARTSSIVSAVTLLLGAAAPVWADVHLNIGIDPFGIVAAPPPVVYAPPPAYRYAPPPAYGYAPPPAYEPPPVVYLGGGRWGDRDRHHDRDRHRDRHR